MAENNVYDLLFIGAGCAGASGAMYGARLSLKTAMVAELPGGLITTTNIVENWPGIKSISGSDLAMKLLEHAQSYDVPLINEKVLEVGKVVDNPPEGKQSGYIVKTKSNEYRAKAVVFATGSKHRKLGVPGEENLENKGVSYCALCDSGIVKGKVVCVVGGGDTAAKEAILLSELCPKVYLFVRGDKLKAELPNIKRIESSDKIEVMYNTEIEDVLGEGKVEKVKLKDGKEIELEAVFVAIGLLPVSDVAKSLGVSLNERAEIVVNRNSETNLPGVYGAGDVCDTKFKQAITSAADAVIAAYFASLYVQQNEVLFE